MAAGVGIDKLAVYLLLWWAMTRTNKRSGLSGAVLTWPVRVDGQPGRGGSRISQEFRPEATERLKAHLGVDIVVDGHYKDAQADVLAVAPGRVARAVRGPRGWYVLLDHGDWASSYLHQSTVDVKAGDQVTAGQKLGRMGADPLDTQHVVHLHLQLAPHGEVVNPAPYLRRAV